MRIREGIWRGMGCEQRASWCGGWFATRGICGAFLLAAEAAELHVGRTCAGGRLPTAPPSSCYSGDTPNRALASAFGLARVDVLRFADSGGRSCGSIAPLPARRDQRCSNPRMGVRGLGCLVVAEATPYSAVRNPMGRSGFGSFFSAAEATELHVGRTCAPDVLCPTHPPNCKSGTP